MGEGVEWDGQGSRAMRQAALTRFASSITIIALFPPSSRMLRPKRPATSVAILRPTAVLPVKEMSSMRGSETIARPSSGPPTSRQETAAGWPSASRASTMMRLQATAVSETEGDGFHRCALPHTRLRVRERPPPRPPARGRDATAGAHLNAVFQNATAHGKLNAVMIPRWPFSGL